MTSQNNLCSVHGTELRAETVGVSYGLVRIDAELAAARAALFPNSRRTVHGGCVRNDEWREADALVCDDCREAEMKWDNEHRPGRGRIWTEEDFELEFAEPLEDGD